MTIRIIFNGEPEDAECIVSIIVDNESMFTRDYLAVGWGWHMSVVSTTTRTPSGQNYFLRRIKNGVSASIIPAQVDADAQRRDATQARSDRIGSAVGQQADAPNPSPDSPHNKGEE